MSKNISPQQRNVAGQQQCSEDEMILPRVGGQPRSAFIVTAADAGCGNEYMVDIPCDDDENQQHHMCIEKVRHTVLSFRLQKAYCTYCTVCALLSVAAFLTTVYNSLESHLQGDLNQKQHWKDILEGGTWQSICWTAVSIALCIEAVAMAIARRSGCSGDWWLAFDAILLVLTFSAWLLTAYRRVSLARVEAEEVDLWLLAVRFGLQPLRVLATASLAHKVKQMHKSNVDISFDDISLGSLGTHGFEDSVDVERDGGRWSA